MKHRRESNPRRDRYLPVNRDNRDAEQAHYLLTNEKGDDLAVSLPFAKFRHALADVCFDGVPNEGLGSLPVLNFDPTPRPKARTLNEIYRGVSNAFSAYQTAGTFVQGRNLDAPELSMDPGAHLLHWHNQQSILITLGNQVYLYHLDSKEITTLMKNEGGLNLAACHSIDDHHVAATLCNHLVITDMNHPQPVETAFDFEVVHVVKFLLSLSDQQMLLGSQLGQILLYDQRETDKCATVFPELDKGVAMTAMALDQGEQFASAYSNGKVAIWDVRQQQAPVMTLSAQEGEAVRALSFDASRQHVLAVGGDQVTRNISVWDTKTDACKPTQSYNTYLGAARALFWSQINRGDLVSMHDAPDAESVSLYGWRTGKKDKVYFAAETMQTGSPASLISSAGSPGPELCMASLMSNESMTFFHLDEKSKRPEPARQASRINDLSSYDIR